jgi:hypothetical protein
MKQKEMYRKKQAVELEIKPETKEFQFFWVTVPASVVVEYQRFRGP